MGTTKRMREFQKALDLAIGKSEYDLALVGDIDDLLFDTMRIQERLEAFKALGSTDEKEAAQSALTTILVDVEDILMTAEDVKKELDAVLTSDEDYDQEDEDG